MTRLNPPTNTTEKTGPQSNENVPANREPSLVSIVTVVRNDAPGLQKTIESVIAQTSDIYEYLVIDGASTDDTLEVASRYCKHIDTLISEPDAGIYDAMNKGAALANGEWIIFMNAGDTFAAPNVLELLEPLLRRGNADVLLGGTLAVMRDELQERVFDRPANSLDTLWQGMPASHQSTFVRTALQQQFGFDTSFQWCADHDMLVRLSLAGKRLVTTNQTICRFDCTPGSPRSLHLYTRERWRSSKGAVSTHRRIMFFGREFLTNVVMQPISLTWRRLAPTSLVMAVRRLRGTA